VRRARAAGASAPTIEAAQLGAAQRCYVCRQGFVELDPRYDRLCAACAALNHRKRAQRADMTGCVAVVTGARIRIGFRVALSLLRAGCVVIATSRFANDTWRRFASERDFEAFRGRLSVVALDLRRLPELERFTGWLSEERGAVDVLVNNAAQTIARPAAYYAAMREIERDAARALPDGVPAAPWLDAADTLSAPGLGTIALGSGAEPEDLRATNSWRASVDEVTAGELASAHAVNALAPYVLLGGLRAALARGAALRGSAFVVNVSATEGQFSQRRKSSRHPHTNMAKAALNMLTLTVADELAREKVYVSSVDPGWVSAQNPFAQAAAMAADGFAPPLDDEDGAARVLDPVYSCKNGEPAVFGALLKDYVPAPW
jgi:NAD(P)-dependent dehydrogenase (short-subunit alcohol dehydrogenase family)